MADAKTELERIMLWNHIKNRMLRVQETFRPDPESEWGRHPLASCGGTTEDFLFVAIIWRSFSTIKGGIFEVIVWNLWRISIQQDMDLIESLESTFSIETPATLKRQSFPI